MMRRRRWLLLTGGAVLAIAIAACGETSSDDDAEDRDDGGLRSGAAEDVAADADDAARPGEPAMTASLASERKVIFETRLELAAEDVTERYHEVGDIARRVGGYVADSRLTAQTANEAKPDARVVVRVPSERREEVLRELRGMMGIEPLSEQTSSTEVTEEYTDLQSRLRNLERSEVRYLDLLDRADSVSDILAVSERLDSVRSQIEQLQGRLNVLDDLVDMATITVTLKPVDEVEEEEEQGVPSFREAWHSAWGTVGDAGRYLLAVSAWVTVGAIVLGPVVVLGSGLRYAAHRRTGATQE